MAAEVGIAHMAMNSEAPANIIVTGLSDLFKGLDADPSLSF